ncbi:hypothetical protein [Curtobacterium sp. UCD-KPL2560]|uniref:hypothetical protein n=1 Tax=Curtobacterium sp. UCD-KPL2560 TaxID=1885315 RepID=UPI00114CA682|nr:hypothetical protein [Curtobacterium sp. UCD-KPL2560]
MHDDDHQPITDPDEIAASAAHTFLARTAMYIGEPVRFDRVTAFISGYSLALTSDVLHRGGGVTPSPEADFRDELREQGRLGWERWDLTVVAEALGWDAPEPPVLADLTDAQHLAAIRALEPLLTRMFRLAGAER